jgi:hypothetical protein
VARVSILSTADAQGTGFRPLLALGGAVALLIALAFCWWQERTIAGLESDMAALRDDLSRTEERAGANAAALLESEAGRSAADRAVVIRDGQVEALAGEIGALQRKLREATKHETKLDAVIAPGIADALCVQYAAASGYAVRSDTHDAAGTHDAGADDTAAGWRYVAALDCSAWRTLTYGHLLEWAGELQRHAGFERVDKNGLRLWADGVSSDRPPQTTGSVGAEVPR